MPFSPSMTVFYESKYKNTRIRFHDGRSFASKLEAGLYDQLKLMELAGEIKDIKCQVRVELTDARIVMIPDFKYFCNRINEEVYAEAKGVETSDYRIKRKLWTVYGPGRLEVYKGSAKKLILIETIVPKRG